VEGEGEEEGKGPNNISHPQFRISKNTPVNWCGWPCLVWPRQWHCTFGTNNIMHLSTMLFSIVLTLHSAYQNL